jgi:hypothetical protein
MHDIHDISNTDLASNNACTEVRPSDSAHLLPESGLGLNEVEEKTAPEPDALMTPRQGYQ